MARKRLMTPQTSNWLVTSVQSSWTSGARVTLSETFYTKHDTEKDEMVDATAQDFQEFDFCCQDIVLDMPADKAPAAGAHIRLTLEQVA